MVGPSEALVTYGSEFVPNGYLVAVPWDPAQPHLHDGISDFPWPLENDDLGQWEKLRRELGVPRSFDGVHVAGNWATTFAYFQRSRALQLDARLQLVRTRYNLPRVEPPDECWRFLGYDVADPMGTFSVLRHEIIAGSAVRLAHWRARLNAGGLFDDLATAEAFIAERSAVIRTDPRGMETAPDMYFVPVSIEQFEETA
jgi:hypothetical protein